MRTHVKVLSWLYIILGILGIMTAIGIFVIIFGGGLISGDRVAIRVTGMVAFLVAGFIIALSVPGIIVGAGLLKFQPWARILALVLGILNLPAVPIGTALGIYAIWALLDDETSSYFNEGPQAPQQKLDPD